VAECWGEMPWPVGCLAKLPGCSVDVAVSSSASPWDVTNSCGVSKDWSRLNWTHFFERASQAPREIRILRPLHAEPRHCSHPDAAWADAATSTRHTHSCPTDQQVRIRPTRDHFSDLSGDIPGTPRRRRPQPTHLRRLPRRRVDNHVNLTGNPRPVAAHRAGTTKRWRLAFNGESWLGSRRRGEDGVPRCCAAGASPR
jgi:hypothetical protein